MKPMADQYAECTTAEPIRDGGSGFTPVRASVIIPAFNDQAGVNRCLQGLAAQTWPQDALEVVIVDNGSSPPLAIERDHPFTVRLIRCATPGSYAARNAGVKVAAGSVLAFLDADCWPDPDWLAQGIRSLGEGAGRAVVGGEVVISKPHEPTAVALYQWVMGFGQESNVREKRFSATANLFCTRAQFDAVGPFDERLLSGGDREWCWRAIAHAHEVCYAPDAIIRTAPRSSLRGAIRQARRVAAGRRGLRALELTHQGHAALAKQRSAWQSVKWILSNRQLGMWDRLRVLWVATLIRGAAAVERFRLALGARAERQ